MFDHTGSAMPVPVVRRDWRITRRRFLQCTGASTLSVALAGFLAACHRDAPPPIDRQDRTDFAPPFAITTVGAPRPLWALGHGATILAPAQLHLDGGASADSPWIASTPGASFQLTLATAAPVQLIVAWADTARHSVTSSHTTWAVHDATPITLVTPPSATGLRLRLQAAGHDVTVSSLALVLANGIRIEPFPDFHRAAFAFSYDWESAMGGLIHSRSAANSEGVGTFVGLRRDGGPVVAEAQDKAMRMRDGARFLAAQFAQYGMHATFYTTGYNLLSGNTEQMHFLNDPTYPDADLAHGWGSDYWRTHPWYGDDPFGTETTHPAWYFASLTHELADAGHEIASHSFGHLYVRGVKPDQLAADLQLWQQTAATQGVPTAPSFAFPWTSSNSLDARFWTIFAQMGWTVLTRLYPRDLIHPYELDRVAADPRLSIFPDFYLPSHSAMLDEATARVEETLARRGYHSFWTHPNEVLEQDGRAVWTQIIAAVAAAQSRGMWIAPVTMIAHYGLAVEQVAVQWTEKGQEVILENRGDQSLNGLTLTLAQPVGGVRINGVAGADVRGDQVRLPILAAGEQVHLSTISAD